MRVTLVVLVSLGLVAPALAINLYNVATIDTSATGLGIARPGSVAFNGTDVYVGGMFTGATITRIGSPLTAPTVLGSFGAGPASGSTNGFVNLDVYGDLVVGATNNGGSAPDIVQTFRLDGTPVGSSDSAILGIPSASPNDRFDGAGIDPGWIAGGGGGGGVTITAYGAGNRYLYDETVTTQLAQTYFYNDDTKTGFRDVHFDAATGDVFFRTLNGIGRGKRVGPNNFVKLDGTTAGTQGIVMIGDGFSSAINVDYLPDFNGDGVNAVIGNWRSLGSPLFSNRVMLFNADAVNAPLATGWFNADGTAAFAAADSASGTYDFSYDPATGLLAVSDWSNEKVYFFAGAPIPEPASLFLLALGGLVLRRR